ncbi:alkene reductase [Sinisalibacter aestuarii]|uniref:Alkene reductase n=2 Tax=Sinisalibacter aestuarii TaxID=2949426 RepID=A0ABQ5LPY3_9RHOB|nr:alkene reductase [Sinisalibacter aestuarii]
MYEKLLSPTKIGAWELANSIVMPPLTRNRADKDCVQNPRAPEYYGMRNAAGLIICEATQISPDATGYPRTPGIWTEEQTARWKEVVDAIHEGDAKAVLQFWHCGRISHPDNQPEGIQPMAPSAVKPENPIYTDVAGDVVDNPMPREMTEEDIQYVLESYRKAAENAKKAGFDGVELHCANGYLIDQFAASNTNIRTDKWGGSRENRVRFMEEAVKAVMKVFPKECVGVRIAGHGTFNEIFDEDPQAKFEAMLGVAEKLGIGYVHIIRPVVSGNIQMEASALDSQVIDTARRIFSGSIIGAAGYDLDSGEAELKAGRVEAVAFGRAHVGNPDLVRRIREGIPLTESNQDTWYTPGDEGYMDYPVAP